MRACFKMHSAKLYVSPFDPAGITYSIKHLRVTITIPRKFKNMIPL